MVAEIHAPARTERDVIFSKDGDATIGSAGHRWYARGNRTLVGILASAGDAPQGADLVFDVLLDEFDGGGTVFTTVGNRPRILDGDNEGLSPTPDIVDVPDGHYLTVYVVQTGVAPNPGSKVDVRILYE